MVLMNQYDQRRDTPGERGGTPCKIGGFHLSHDEIFTVLCAMAHLVDVAVPLIPSGWERQ